MNRKTGWLLEASREISRSSSNSDRGCYGHSHTNTLRDVMNLSLFPHSFGLISRADSILLACLVSRVGEVQFEIQNRK